jgi:GNAT superfamily N-acetyltransferase
LTWAVFDEFESPDYAEEGIREFKEFIEYDSVMQRCEKGEMSFWGCFDGAALVGITATRDTNHISLLFVKKEYHRRGIARGLFNAVKKNCERENIKIITVNSSPYAKEAYRRMGFEGASEEKIKNGIRYIPMVYLMK